MAESTNRVHVSPGVYASETVDMKTATNSVGVTKLAVVGETLKGPAFQPYWVSSPKEYANVFGGTSTQKFQGSNYPQYELPYIANEYLSQSDQLCVVRTLGLSGYNAGPAWAITGEKSTESGSTKYVIAILRSRGTYKYRSEYAKLADNDCTCTSAYDALTFDVGEINEVVSCSAPTTYNMSAVQLSPYYDINSTGDACSSYSLTKDKLGFSAASGNLGKFTINVLVGAFANGTKPGPQSAVSGSSVNIPVSLNPSDKDYIIKVLGTSNNDGDLPLFVETLYDVAWNDLIVNQGYDTISNNLTNYNVGYIADYSGMDAINGILTKYEGELAKKDVGKRFLYSTNITDGSPADIEYYVFNEQNVSDGTKKNCEEGTIYTVTQIVDENNKRHYVYRTYDGDRLKADVETSAASKRNLIVYNYEDGLYYKNDGTINETKFAFHGNDEFTCTATGKLKLDMSHMTNPPKISNWKLVGVNFGDHEPVAANDDESWNVEKGNTYKFSDGPGSQGSEYDAIIYPTKEDGSLDIKNQVVPIHCNMNDYKSAYRYSSTPWVVSNVKGDANHINVNKLFRFHTISDGTNSINEVKVSIENIRPDEGTFDVVVRAYDDVDSSTSILERFSKCSMASGKQFVGYKIGTLDGQYESKSKYITVEVLDSLAAKNSVPAGFLGYPMPLYSGATVSDGIKTGISMVPIKYNTEYDSDTNKRKQYFGISDITGYDYDYFSFKGNMSTLEDPDFMSHGFHLDCRMDVNTYQAGEAPKISVDGIEGYVFDGVSVNSRTETLSNTPIISSENDMSDSIYEDVKLRKFTLCFAGGFDGWDIYRDQRTNTDEYSYSSYKGYVNKNTGIGYAFNKLNGAATYNIEGAAITSDYYSTLAAISLLKNPEEVDINLLATPGIDMINNTKLVKEVFDILEDRADTFYVVTTPDKELGASDYADELPEIGDIVDTLVDKEMYSDYAATYYPWVKIEDNGEYIYLPATRDIVRNMAQSDNGNTTQNLAPAGLTRGRSNAIRARKNLKVGECDTLYENNLNPVRTYAQEGIVIMGQKTLRKEDDLLNRIDVRRCVLRMRKLIAIGTLGLIFDPNDAATVKSFKSIISGIMEGFVSNRAISNWKMEVDESDEAKDRLEISATIYVKPIRALEYISLNFVVTNNGTYFES